MHIFTLPHVQTLRPMLLMLSYLILKQIFMLGISIVILQMEKLRISEA